MKPLIVIYQSGKVGSRTVSETLKSKKYIVEKFDICHSHFMRSSDLPDSIRFKEEFNKNNHIKIITLVRDPISRTISDLFFNSEVINFVKHLKNKKEISDFIIESISIADKTLKSSGNVGFNKLINHTEYQDFWFKSEFFKNIGINIYDENFDYEQKNIIIKKDNIEVLLIRCEELNENGALNIKRFLDLKDDDDLSLINQNITPKNYQNGEMTEYGSLMKNLKFPENLLDHIYYDLNGFFCENFYKDKIDAFKNRWIGKMPNTPE